MSFIWGDKTIDTLKQERILKNDNPRIVIGVNGNHSANISNRSLIQSVQSDEEYEKRIKMAFQKIKINNEHSRALIGYKECSNILCYNFENDLTLCFDKTNKQKVTMTLIGKGKYSQSVVDPTILKTFSIIGFNSPEFDEIGNFIK